MTSPGNNRLAALLTLMFLGFIVYAAIAIKNIKVPPPHIPTIEETREKCVKFRAIVEFNLWSELSVDERKLLLYCNAFEKDLAANPLKKSKKKVAPE
jgi:hypothetical protein